MTLEMLLEVFQWAFLVGILFIQSRQLPVLSRIVELAEKLNLIEGTQDERTTAKGKEDGM